MDYNKTIWEDNKSEINAAKLNNIETGIEYAVNSVENINVQLDKRIKFKVVGEEDTEVPPIHGGNSYDDTELVKKINDIKSEIEEAKGDEASLSSKITSIDEQLNNIKNKRFFKPKLAHSQWLIGNKNGDIWDPIPDSTIDYLVNVLIKYKVEETIVYFSVDYKNGIYTTRQNLDQIEKYIKNVKSKGIAIKALKFHQSSGFIYDNKEKFFNEYQQFIISVLNRFKQYDIEYACLFNENYHVSNIESVQYISSLISAVKQLGYKTTISFAGVGDYNGSFTNYPTEIVELLDGYFLNLYPRASKKYEKTVFYDIINGLQTNLDLEAIASIKSKYNKEIVISETGVQDYWDALSEPSVALWDSNATVSKGKAPLLYLEGLFNYYNSENISSMCWWYEFEPHYAEIVGMTDLISKYLGG